MEAAFAAALSRALLSADLCEEYAYALGISVFLLVPVCMGHPGLGDYGPGV